VGLLIGAKRCTTNHTVSDLGQVSAKWYEFDLGWTYIRVLQALGLAKVFACCRSRRGSAKRLVDLDTLQAVIANRYDLWPVCARSRRALVMS